MEEKRKIFLVQGYHHCHIGSALQKYLKGLGEYSVESIDMYDIEPERIGFGEADIVILTMGVEPEKGWRHPEKFYEIHEKTGVSYSIYRKGLSRKTVYLS